ncbi:MAG TPA: transketolase C-terminal domain-containing protein, partial [Thermoanaerobaculaceae bacterium]|nr:transketolase C-terminal domain-containing protein [Thermoanaerobaculaceae bacterium]
VSCQEVLRTAIRCDDPVMFLEHKHLYRQTHNKAAYPGPDHMVPFGKASVVRDGDDLTVITYGATVVRSVQAARRLEAETGLQAEILDLRSLSPYDWEAIATSVRKTGRALVVHEDLVTWGYGAELAARIGDELFAWLDAPVRRHGSKDTFLAYAPTLEEVILPQPDSILATMKQLAAF